MTDRIDDLRMQNLFAREGQEAMGQLGATPPCMNQSTQPRVVGTELLFQHFGVAQNHSQHVVEVVCHASRKLPDGV